MAAFECLGRAVGDVEVRETGERGYRWLFHMDADERSTFRIVPEKYITLAQDKLEW